MKKSIFAVISITVGLLAAPSSGAIREVPSMYSTIQAGISAAVDGDTVLVADGVYTGSGNRDISFMGKAITVQSVNGPSACTIDCQGSETDIYLAFEFISGEDNNSLLTGFKIINAYQATYMAEGGAIFIENASPIISNCIFEDNYSEKKGAAINAIGAMNLTIQDCDFTANETWATQAGGAIYIKESDATISGCNFTGNSISGGYFGGGGAIFGFRNSGLLIDQCSFVANIALSSSNGGAVRSTTLNTNETTIISHCLFENNSSTTHSGALNVRGAVNVSSCEFINNSAGQRGGAIYFEEESAGSVTDSCFEDNTANLGGGICCSFSTPLLGGSELNANTFSGNFACTGADIACLFVPDPPINAQWNHFTGYYNSDYYVSPTVAFDLEHCTYVREPIAQDVYVKVDGSNTNDGLTWDTAFQTIQYAARRIRAESGLPLTIHVGPGVFSPTTTGEVFPLPVINGVSLRGESRYGTILDAESTAGVLFVHHDENVTIENMTITGGYDARGGGIYCHKCSPVIQRCEIVGNTAGTYRKEGGGIFLHNASPYISDCNIVSNSADHGGGIYAYGSSALIENCCIQSNRAFYNGGGVSGEFNGHPSLVFNCTITHNTSDWGGGGVACWSNDHNFINCLIAENTARYGGGIYGYCVGETLTFTNCTITENTATHQGGAYYGSKIADPLLRNCILWRNEPNEAGGIPPGITYSAVQGGFPGTGNIDADPLFTTGWHGHFYLSHLATGHVEDSPCIDAGGDLANTVCSYDLPEEICMSDLTMRTDLQPDSGTVDMGFHYPEVAPICENTGDVNFDRVCTSGDAQLAFMIALGAMTPTWQAACAADCNASGDVTAGDAQTIFMAALGMGECADPVMI